MRANQFAKQIGETNTTYAQSRSLSGTVLRGAYFFCDWGPDCSWGLQVISSELGTQSWFGTGLDCACSSYDAYILFGGDSKIDTFTFSANPADPTNGQCYFGQVADTDRSKFVSFKKNSSSANPRVLITAQTAVSDAEFSVIDPSLNRVNNLFYEMTGASFSEDIENGYYALPE